MDRREDKAKTARLKRACAKLEKFTDSKENTFYLRNEDWFFYACVSGFKNRKYYTAIFMYHKLSGNVRIDLSAVNDDKEKLKSILKPWNDLIFRNDLIIK